MYNSKLLPDDAEDKNGVRHSRDKVVSKEFMRKYIHIAKAVTPVLTEEAANHIAEEYSRLRSQEQMGSDIARVSRSCHSLSPNKRW